MNRAQLVAALTGLGLSADYSSLDLEGLQVDLQGWGSTSPVFEEVIQEVRPEIVVEIGTWKGASVLHMHELSRKYGCDTCFVCVDTWLGSSEHWLSQDDRRSLMLRANYPTIYRQFVFNIVAAGATADIFPLATTSTSAAEILRRLGVIADAVYIDAGHEEEEVAADLNRYYELIRPGGLLFGDEYHSRWAGAVRAVDGFSKAKRLKPRFVGGWWIFRKPD
jgi:Methyltransferase domain